ncbi:hypothetical protein MERGE_001880 [Pneumocystis wakefieldiae]|uniref:DASH complex subunit SPC19 n=1 Tax=Pneumocystis wakefieldiae TaxID=38082 RepID=A0A899FZ76_9ASCO|nr:hypothetical protein MERGE_001880 [Pneumocystis wakefieldiae]
MVSPRVQSRQRTTSSIAPLNDYLSSLEGCVSSLNACNYRMDLLLATLSAGIDDFPRIQTVLANRRHFEVVSETDVREAQQSLEHEVYPQILELLQRAEAGIAKLERREKTLQGKSELQEVRLQQKPSKSRNTLNSASEQLSKANELHALQVKKERLLYSLNRLSHVSGDKG